MAAITSVLDEFAGLDKHVHHIIGNHCLYNFSRQELNERLGVRSAWAHVASLLYSSAVSSAPMQL